MKYAVIDLGSNTIKLCIYNETDGRLTQEYYKAHYAGILQYIQNRSLSEQGKAVIVSSLSQFREEALQHECTVPGTDIFCISTASLRFVDQLDQLIAEVEDLTGIRILPLSGETEAYYNYLSSASETAQKDFLGGDLGGGSMQLFECREGKLITCDSLPVGALKLKNQLISGRFPTPAELDQINDYVTEQMLLSKLALKKQISRLCFMGGSMRLIAKLIGSPVFSAAQLIQLMKQFSASEETMVQMVSRHAPERVETILPAMAAIKTVIDYFNIQMIECIQGSVREGFLIDHISRR